MRFSGGNGDEESFSIHTDENDIYDRLSYMRIRKLDCLNDSQSLGIAFAPARKELKRAVY